jgi:hypothetical protein
LNENTRLKARKTRESNAKNVNPEKKKSKNLSISKSEININIIPISISESEYQENSKNIFLQFTSCSSQNVHFKSDAGISARNNKMQIRTTTGMIHLQPLGPFNVVHDACSYLRHDDLHDLVEWAAQPPMRMRCVWDHLDQWASDEPGDECPSQCATNHMHSDIEK